MTLIAWAGVAAATCIGALCIFLHATRETPPKPDEEKGASYPDYPAR
jgi:hypothetical protein